MEINYRPGKKESLSRANPGFNTDAADTIRQGGKWLLFCTILVGFCFAAQKPKMKSHYRGHKMALWLNLIPQLHQPGDDEVTMRHHHFFERESHYYAGIYLLFY